MIRLLFDTTIGGVRFGKGSILNLEPAIETDLIAEGDADRNALPQLVAQSFAPVVRSSANSAADASYAALGSVIIPGGLMGPNSKLEVEVSWNLPNSASTKILTLDFAGTTVAAPGLTTSDGYTIFKVIQNLNSLGAQRTPVANGYGSGAYSSTTVDTSVDALMEFRCKWGAATLSESITLVGYSIWHYPGS